MEGNRIPPHNVAAEESLLGAMMLNAGAIIEAIDILEADDFYVPLNALLFKTICDLFEEGQEVDYVTITNRAGRFNDSDWPSKIVALQMNTPSASSAGMYAQIVYEKSCARKAIYALTSATNELYLADNPYEIASGLSKDLALLGKSPNGEPESLTLEEWIALSKIEDSSPVIIPGIMRQGWRTIVVGGEGVAKTTILRTISMAVAQGHHPFWFPAKIVPRRVLYVDLENPLEVIGEPHVEAFVKYLCAKDPEIYNPARLKVWRRPAGINIRTQKDRADFQKEIITHAPDLVCIGPLYKMFTKNRGETDEDAALEVMHILDDLRTRYRFGLMMEHHAPKGQAGQSRDMTPFGSSSWLRWPEVGISLYVDKKDPRMVHVRRFRGDRLSNLAYPDQIIRDRDTIINGRWEDAAPPSITTSTR